MLAIESKSGLIISILLLMLIRKHTLMANIQILLYLNALPLKLFSREKWNSFIRARCTSHFLNKLILDNLSREM